MNFNQMGEQFAHPCAHINLDTRNGWKNHPHADHWKWRIAQAEILQVASIKSMAENICPDQQAINIFSIGDIEKNILLSLILLMPVRDSPGKADQIYISLQRSVSDPMPEIDFSRSVQPSCQHPNG